MEKWEARASERNAHLNAVTRGGTRTGPDAVEVALGKIRKAGLGVPKFDATQQKDIFREAKCSETCLYLLLRELRNVPGILLLNLLDILRAAEGYLQAATEVIIAKVFTSGLPFFMRF